VKEVFQIPDYHTMSKQPNKKAKMVGATARKSERFIYPDLDDFLLQYPVATTNQYGERVITGRRVC